MELERHHYRTAKTTSGLTNHKSTAENQTFTNYTLLPPVTIFFLLSLLPHSILNYATDLEKLNCSVAAKVSTQQQTFNIPRE